MDFTPNTWVREQMSKELCVQDKQVRSLLLLRDTAKPEIRGRAVGSVLAAGCTSVSVTVRLEEGERKVSGFIFLSMENGLTEFS